MQPHVQFRYDHQNSPAGLPKDDTIFYFLIDSTGMKRLRNTKDLFTIADSQ